MKKKDVQIVKQVVLASNPLLRIDVEQFDPIHLILLNVVWAMLQDPENTIIQICWVRAQYILAVQDENWELNELLEKSDPNTLRGCRQYLVEIGEQRSNELRISRKPSIMQNSDVRDIRDYCGDVENFLVIETLIKLDEHSFNGTDKLCLRN